MQLRRVPAARVWASVYCVLIGLLLAGCPAHFVSDYDEIFDKAVTDTQKKTDAFLLKLQDVKSPLRRYANAKDTYADIRNDIHSLKLRAQANNANNLNDLTLKQLETIDDNVTKLQARHEATPNGPSVDFFRIAQDIIDTQFSAILKFEIAKKRGGVKS